jgi:hypothetical protein
VEPFFRPDRHDDAARPARPEQIAACFARMRITLLRTTEDNLDIEVLIDTMIDLCRNYPADILITVARDWMKTHKFFPIPREFIAHVECEITFRKALLRAFEGVRNPLLAEKAAAKRVPADPRLNMSFRELPKKDWLPCHWDWYLGDAEHMAKLNRDNGRQTQADEWQAISDKRQQERRVSNA